MTDQLMAALNRTAASLVPHLQRRASSMGWPDQLAKSLTITSDPEGNLIPTWPKKHEQAILAMEGGMPGQAPRPVIHHFFSNPDGEKAVREAAQAQLVHLLRDLERRIF